MSIVVESGDPATTHAAIGFELRRDVAAGRHERVIVRDGVAVLQGERVWLLRDTSEVVDAVAESLAGFSTRLAPDLLEIQFGNAVGRFNLGAVDGRPLGVINVQSGKWTSAHFESMLADIVATAATLPFAGGRGGALPYDRRYGGAETLYQRFVYVRHIVLGQGPPATQLLPAIEAIVADPHRVWMQTSRLVPPALARDVDIGALTAAIGGRNGYDRGGRADLPIVRALRGHVPRAITEISRTPSVDTAENRFVKAFLNEIDGIVGAVITRASGETGESPASQPGGWLRRVEADARAVRGVIRTALRHSLWSEVGTMRFPPLGSTVLQRRRGYRQVFGHAARLRLSAHLPLDDATAKRLLEGKDIATLYELWCFFRVADGLRSCLGAPLSAKAFKSTWLSMDVPYDWRLAWPGGIELLYNARFPGGGIGDRSSYSVGLRPDIALRVPAGPNAGLHLLDAKFRLDRTNALWLRGQDAIELDDEGSGASDPTVAESTFKNDDLYKMHTYRDAIAASRSVWILYPGDGAGRRFYPAHRQEVGSASPFGGHARGGAIDVDGLSSVPLDGVGAIPLLPGIADEREGRPNAALIDLLAELTAS